MTSGSVVRDLRALGLVAGATVMVHASLRKVGPIEGRAASVVRAIDEAVTPNGTWMMVLGAADEWAWVNDRAEAERMALLADAVPFDANEAPAEPDVSVLAEVMRTTPGTLVSDHPEGRFGARGRLAAHLTRDVPWDDYYGPGSPLERLIEAGGSVLRLGADINTVTLLHYAEYVAAVPHKRTTRRYRRVRTADGGSAIRTVNCLDDSNGIVDWQGPDYFGLLLNDYLSQGRARRGKVGQADSELIDATDLHQFAVDWMTRHLAPRRG